MDRLTQLVRKGKLARMAAAAPDENMASLEKRRTLNPADWLLLDPDSGELVNIHTGELASAEDFAGFETDASDNPFDDDYSVKSLEGG